MPVTFGLKNSPSQVAYADILRVWRKAAAIPEIAHAWLFDHLLPIYGDLGDWCSKDGRCSPLSPRRPRGSVSA